MSDLIIVCEGQTEQAFCDKILKNHLAAHNVNIRYPLIAHPGGGGGIVKWPQLKSDILAHHTQSGAAYITTFIDYYGIKPHHNFPDWNLAQTQVDKPTRMSALEAAMKADILQAVGNQFIPYIQLHEFEALVLSDHTVFAQRFNPQKYNAPALAALCANPPETINDGVATAPSKRLKQIVPGYNKTVDGVEIAKLTGLAGIRARCPRFNDWISILEGL